MTIYQYLFNQYGLKLKIGRSGESPKSKAIIVSLQYQGLSNPKSKYEVEVSKDNIFLLAKDPEGLFNSLQTFLGSRIISSLQIFGISK